MVQLERIFAARDVGGSVRLMQTSGFSWCVLSELCGGGMEISADGASSTASPLWCLWPLAGSFGAETHGDPSGVSYQALSMTIPDITHSH